MDKTLELVGDMLTEGGYLRVGDLVQRFVEIDAYFNGEPWNLHQILTNIHILVPLSKEDVARDTTDEYA